MLVTNSFFLFPQCFLPFPKQISIFNSKLSSANAFNLDQSNISLFCKELDIKATWIGGLANVIQMFIIVEKEE